MADKQSVLSWCPKCRRVWTGGGVCFHCGGEGRLVKSHDVRRSVEDGVGPCSAYGRLIVTNVRTGARHWTIWD